MSSDSTQPEAAPIFREQAIQRLNSPEQLDTVMQVLDWKGYAVLWCAAVLVALVFIWSLFGSISFSVSGNGILLSPEGIVNVVASGSGQVARILVTPGTTITTGAPIAELAQPELDSQILQTKAELDGARLRRDKLRAHHAATLKVIEDNTKKNVENQAFRLEYLKQHEAYLRERLQANTLLQEKGIFNVEDVQRVRTQLDQTLDNSNTTNQKILELKSELDVSRSTAEKEILDVSIRVSELEEQLRAMESVRAKHATVVAPTDGRLMESCVEVGAMLSPGSLVAVMGRNASSLEAMVYFPADSGRKIDPGMKALVYPGTVNKQEYGGITGSVADVSEYLVSEEGLVRVLNNRVLAQKLIQDKGALVGARLILDRAPQAPSGFTWSSSRGPDSPIVMGTVCEARVLTEERRPFDLVVPHIREMLGWN